MQDNFFGVSWKNYYFDLGAASFKKSLNEPSDMWHNVYMSIAMSDAFCLIALEALD